MCFDGNNKKFTPVHEPEFVSLQQCCSEATAKPVLPLCQAHICVFRNLSSKWDRSEVPTKHSRVRKLPSCDIVAQLCEEHFFRGPGFPHVDVTAQHQGVGQRTCRSRVLKERQEWVDKESFSKQKWHSPTSRPPPLVRPLTWSQGSTKTAWSYDRWRME